MLPTGGQGVNSTDDRLVADYLNRLALAATLLPAEGRDELMEAISAHIAEARAGQPDPGRGVPAGVAEVLERLGSPEEIVRAAAGYMGADQGVLAQAEPAGAGPGAPRSARGARGPGAVAIATVLLLLLGGVLIGVGWIAGAILLWASPRWPARDKLVATLVWPGGLAAVLALPRFGSGLPPVLILALLLIGVSGPILVAIRLLRHADRAPARPADPARTHAVT
jgi:uncharacterized membrane protein